MERLSDKGNNGIEVYGIKVYSEVTEKYIGCNQ